MGVYVCVGGWVCVYVCGGAAYVCCKEFPRVAVKFGLPATLQCYPLLCKLDHFIATKKNIFIPKTVYLSIREFRNKEVFFLQIVFHFTFVLRVYIFGAETFAPKTFVIEIFFCQSFYANCLHPFYNGADIIVLPFIFQASFVIPNFCSYNFCSNNFCSYNFCF